MTVKSLILKHFRNFATLDLALDPGFNFFFGLNAQGKTNVIEAIYYLACLKSFRTTDKGDLIQNGAAAAKLSAAVEKNGLASRIDVSLSIAGKTVLVNGKTPPSQKEYAELIPVLLFEPRHIYLFRDSPSERRRYLNRALYLQDASTLGLVRDYEKIIAQKNKILKDAFWQNGRPNTHLAAWNDRLAQVGAQIIKQRQRWFENIQKFLAVEYQALSHGPEELRFEYRPSGGLFGKDALAASESDLQNLFFQILNEKESEEIARRESIVGPHRDDFQAFLGERDLAQFGSQGENRSAVIALKLAELKLYHQKFGKMPLFLLDDVASELDAKRCEYLYSYLRDESVQAFLTTPENNRITPAFLGKSACFEVQAGVINAQPARLHYSAE